LPWPVSLRYADSPTEKMSIILHCMGEMQPCRGCVHARTQFIKMRLATRVAPSGDGRLSSRRRHDTQTTSHQRSRTDTAVIRSGRPFSFTSPTATARGPLCTPQCRTTRKLPSPRPNRTTTLFAPELAVTRSRRSSKSEHAVQSNCQPYAVLLTVQYTLLSLAKGL
jgi:hypothetical protein